MTIYMKDIIKYLLKRKKRIMGLFAVLFLIAFVLLTVEADIERTDMDKNEIILSDDERMTALMYYQTDSLMQNMNNYMDSIIMKIDCNNAWYMSLSFSYEGENWEDKYAVLNVCGLELAGYIDKALGTGEKGFEDIVQVTVEYIEDKNELYITVELYYYNEQNLLEMGQYVKDFLENIGQFKLLNEYVNKIKSRVLAERQMNIYGWQYSLYDKKVGVKNRLTVNGEKYYNYFKNSEMELAEETPDRILNVKRTVLYSVFVAMGGILIQCSIYTYLYISGLVKGKKSTESESVER